MVAGSRLSYGQTVEVRVSRRARRYIQEHGGRLFLWVDREGDFGVLKCAVTPPADAGTFVEEPADGLAVYVEDELPRPERIVVQLWALPWGSRLDVTSSWAPGTRTSPGPGG
jgi:hypothetical protein